MSAYVVTKATLDAAVTFEIRRASLPEAEATKRGRILWNLNRRAVIGLYGTKHLGDITPEEVAAYEYEMRTESDVVLHKSYACLVYQCAEDPVYGTPAYNRLNELCEAHKAMESTDEWQAAPWGLE